MANQPAPSTPAASTSAPSAGRQLRYYSTTRLTLAGIILAAFVLAGTAFWRTDFHTAWAGSSFPTIEIEGELFYVVRSGDTVATLAEAFGVSEEEFLAANELAPDANLRVGQRVRVPAESDLYLEPADAEMLDSSMEGAESEEQDDADGESTAGRGDESPVQSTDGEFYIVVLGDSLQRIERITGVDAYDIAAYNNLTRPFPLYKGQRLRLTPPAQGMNEGMQATPQTAAQSAPAVREYTVRTGDTLRGIARHFGIEVDALVAANRLTGPYLYTGQILTIPAAAPAEQAADEAADEAAADAEMDEEMAEEMAEPDAAETDMLDEEATEAEDAGAEVDEAEDAGTDANEAEDAGTEDTGGTSGAKGGQADSAAPANEAESPDEATPDEATDEAQEDADTDAESGLESDSDAGMAEEDTATEDAATEDAAKGDMAEADMESGITLAPELALWQDLGESRIFVFSPAPDGAYHSQLEVIGLSQTFEGNVEMELVTADGEVLAERYATGGSVDGYNFFRTGLRFTVQEPTTATLTVFERSMEDGQGMLETVEIPLILLPGQRFIDIHQPRPGDKLCGMVLLAGYSNTFEGNVSLEITNPEGEIQATGFATGGNLGIYREFFHSFDYTSDAPTPLLITAYELDAADMYDRIDSLTVPVSYFPADAPECQ